LQIPERKVRRIIQTLIEDYDFPIGSSVDERPGYFKIVTEDDFDIAIRHLKPRAVKIFKRLRALEKLAAQFGQVNIEEVIP
jgi:transcription initiation factor IIE alpha subunit